ncbi:MAG: hypothetical protein M1831_005571 [Alyxoria varia]|nr:MAG: hypothetical protein M1831_005571 [Alyxoria varia]
MASPRDTPKPANGESTRSPTSDAPQSTHTDQQQPPSQPTHPQSGGINDLSRAFVNQPTATNMFSQTYSPAPQFGNPSVNPFSLPSKPNDPNNIFNDRNFQAYMNSGFSPFSASTQEILKRVGASPNVSAGSPEWEAARRRVIESMNNTSASKPSAPQVRSFQWGKEDYAYVLSKDVKKNWRASWPGTKNASPSAPVTQNGTTPESSVQAPSDSGVNTNASAPAAISAAVQDTMPNDAAAPSRGSGRGPGRPRGRGRGRPQTRNRGGTSSGRKRKRDDSDGESSDEAVGLFLTLKPVPTFKFFAYFYESQSGPRRDSQSSELSNASNSEAAPYYTVTKFGRNVQKPQPFKPTSATVPASANKTTTSRAVAGTVAPVGVAPVAPEPLIGSSIPPPIPPTTPISGLTAPRGRRPKHSKPPEFVLCRKCGRDYSPESNVIVFCDGCNVSWHQWCHDPPIPREVVEVEKMSWFCGGCANQRELEQCPIDQRKGAEELGLTAEESTQQSKYLSTLPHSTLSTLLTQATAQKPDLPIFPPQTKSLLSQFRPQQHHPAHPPTPASQPRKRGRKPKFTSNRSEPSAVPAPAVKPSANGDEPPRSPPYLDYDNPNHDPPATFPRPGRGPIGLTGTADTPEDVRWMVDKDWGGERGTFRHLVDGSDGQEHEGGGGGPAVEGQGENMDVNAVDPDPRMDLGEPASAAVDNLLAVSTEAVAAMSKQEQREREKNEENSTSHLIPLQGDADGSWIRRESSSALSSAEISVTVGSQS